MGIFSRAGAARYNAEAEQCVERGQWQKASALFWLAIGEAPREPNYYYNLGLCIMQAAQAGTTIRGGVLEAIDLFRTSLAFKLDCAEAWLALGKALGVVVTTCGQDVKEETRWLVYTAALGALAVAAALDAGSVKHWAVVHFVELRSLEGAHFKMPATKAWAVATFAVACGRCCAQVALGEAHGAFLEDYAATGEGLLERARALSWGAPAPGVDLNFPERADSKRLQKSLFRDMPNVVEELLR